MTKIAGSRSIPKCHGSAILLSNNSHNKYVIRCTHSLIDQLIADYQMINSSTPLLNLTITFQPLSMFRWQLYSAQSLRNRFNIMGNLMGEEEDEDQDSVKEVSP
jgi:hypothetical protein